MCVTFFIAFFSYTDLNHIQMKKLLKKLHCNLTNKSNSQMNFETRGQSAPTSGVRFGAKSTSRLEIDF